MTVVEQTQGAPRPTPVRIGGARGGPPLSTVLRKDNWRLQPTLTALGLLGFIGYSVWAALRNGDFYAGNVGRDYLSPLYSPCLTHSCTTAGYVWGGWSWWRVSPAWLILAFPGAFRTTCYYYRKAYYRSIWMAPPACAVGEPHSKYTGETRLPLIMHNLHRYAFYAGLLLNMILTYDAVVAFRDTHDRWGHMSVGTLVLVVNAVLLWLYSLSCHSCRHIVGGRLKHFSKHPVRYKAWGIVSKLNQKHMQFAWVSLIFVGLADAYVRLVASGTIHNPYIF